MQECGKPTIYANVISVETAQSDFLIRFGIKKDRRRDVSEEDFDLNVILSPQTAKEFLNILTNGISQYEMLYGPITKSSPHRN
ncbi:hypothetical protein AN618_18630 [Fervidicola ferrireducens]|uniref:DUF3467 domain-containing protein n=1 Tax=Fervidicola ferrireducens TaxID=520764 RepID=A0A140L4M0_9FIRM|nr:DUF3467 domain-containing protein [Fervidicola ferrireducens]KXG75495.1 hypothetical protein AN618_18630 [Fervidicola ferrireducens]